MSCKCFELEGNTDESIQKSNKISSEIEDTGQPYKTIEAIINNNRMILRIQKLAIQQPEKWEPSCDCLEETSKKKLEVKSTDYHLPHNESSLLISQNAPIYYSSVKSRNERINTAANTIENPNIFLLKIRKRSETWDKKKENIDLEFRTPRPWPKPIPKKPRIIEKTLLEVKQSEIIIEDKKDSAPPKKKKKNKKKKKKNKKKKKKKK